MAPSRQGLACMATMLIPMVCDLRSPVRAHVCLIGLQGRGAGLCSKHRGNALRRVMPREDAFAAFQQSCAGTVPRGAWMLLGLSRRYICGLFKAGVGCLRIHSTSLATM
eukprot:TRINITY_DN80420_c0_g1_i1.p1 TRINITY_DN80420_c0_g1~~TRINITY_DN80420_c0_g1_i1.p1  ORF type:complete len:124 (-),score=10.29 TRINITY_DN80420_c0_g1_i1:63-389(-)